MTMPAPTMNDDGLKNGLIASGVLHLIGLLFLIFGLPRLMPPPPIDHPPVPFEIVEIAELTNTRVKDEPEPETKPPVPEPPKPQPQTQQTLTPPPPDIAKPPPEAEALKAAPVPKPKPKPPETKPQTDEFDKLLKNLEANKKPEAPKVADSKPDTKTPAPPVASQAPSLSSRVTISEIDALVRQMRQCWNEPIGARDAQNLVVELNIDVNPDRTVLNTDIVDKNRYANDTFFRAAADAAVRAVRNPKCSPLDLPADKYDDWKRLHFFFRPEDML